MKKQFKLTRDGIIELEEELKGLISQRSTITESIKTARELGDLSENAEYASARAEQDRNETRITEIENILKNVEIIKIPKNNHKVILGSYVTLEGEGGKSKEFKVVGTVEADPLEGKISDESPIGRVLLGKRLGDEVEIANSSEVAVYKIVKVA
jgi:transcription elongation factor GreA